MNKPFFLAIVGPTASGKSTLAINIAKQFKSVILSMDSMQIYKGMNIGTAKISVEEMEGISHELIDIVNPKESFSVSEYVHLAKQLIQHYNTLGVLPILTGGTALYLKAILHNFGLGTASADLKFRNWLYELSEEEDGKEKLYSRLCEIDPRAAKKLHKNDVRRVVRALEIFHVTGKLFSEQKDEISNEYNHCILGIIDDRNTLYKHIDERVDKMMEIGLLDEVTNLINEGMTFTDQSMQGIGYKEFQPYFKKECTLDDVIYKIKLNSRHYAKRQITFFKSFPDLIWLDRNSDNLLNEAIKIIGNSSLKEVLTFEYK